MMKSLACLVVILGLSGSRTAYANWNYYYAHEQQPLTVDVARVAINKASAPDLAAWGIAPDDINPWPITGWWMANVPASLRSTVGIETLVSQIAAESDVAFVSPIFMGSDGGPVIITPDILVRFHDGIDAASAEAIIAASGVGAIAEDKWGNISGSYRIRSDAGSGFAVLAAANQLAEMAEVDYSEPDVIFTGSGSLIPNDTGFPYLWGIHNTGQFGGPGDMDMDGPEAWDETTGDPSIVVVIIDVGVQQNHPDINQRAGNDFTHQATGGGPVNSFDNHGTPVAGCVSAIINNNLGTVGIAPNCLTASARTFIAINPEGNWTTKSSWTVNALAWAESIGARVTNNSNYYGFLSNTIANKYAQTRDAGIVHFSSAGNFGNPSITYPASLPDVNAVAALEPNGALAWFSNYGEGLAFSAPGVIVYTTDRTGNAGWAFGDYVFADGTSFASPYAAGVAALVLSEAPTLSAETVEVRLQQTAVDLGATGYDTTFGWGFVNAASAITTDCNENGVPDDMDIAAGTSPDCNGNVYPDECEEDFDGDGVINECDGCPFDPDKILPGLCGCGVSDADTDGDGAPDCDDDCRYDPFKTDPGICGCGTPDTDSDGDTVLDCVDGCPNDPFKTVPGICGCQVPDDDSDGDGVADCGDQCPGIDDTVFAPECLAAIPTVTGWGLVILALILLVVGKTTFGWPAVPRKRGISDCDPGSGDEPDSTR